MKVELTPDERKKFIDWCEWQYNMQRSLCRELVGRDKKNGNPGFWRANARYYSVSSVEAMLREGL